MKRLSKLRKLVSYLQAFSLDDYRDITPIMVVNRENATSQLDKVPGDQVLIALPEAREYGTDSDSFKETLSTAFFVLAKINNMAWTPELADETYRRLLEISRAILDKLTSDLTGGEIGMPCPLLAGLTLTDVSIMPEYSLFSGWSGWSIEITLG